MGGFSADYGFNEVRSGFGQGIQKGESICSWEFKFTIELPGTDGLPFLDTLIKPTPNSIESIVCRKPTHTDRYLDYNSNHPTSAKLSVIHTLNHRAKQVCSTPELLAKEMDHLHKQGSHFFSLTKFPDFSRNFPIFPGINVSVFLQSCIQKVNLYIHVYILNMASTYCWVQI